jgi:hypothetical protein
MGGIKKIGFLYFEEIHHIPHFIGIATELSKYPGYQIDILTYRGQHPYLFHLIDLLSAKDLNVVQLDTSLLRRAMDRLSKRKKPSSVYLYKKHKKLLLGYDALVFTEKNHQYLHKKRGKAKLPYLIAVNHGPPGRAHSFQNSVKLFDLNLLGGEFYIRTLKEKGLLSKHYSAIGYPKFDIVKKEAPDEVIFDNDRPTVLYNPHFHKLASSFYQYGTDVLEYFYRSKEYNLIFAPHIYLFNRKGFLRPDAIQEKYFDKDNIHIDLGSLKSSNMTYVLSADIYLGDISSQIFEFGIRPRPAIFIDVNNIKWQNDINYRFWKTGEVITAMDQLDRALKIGEEKKRGYFEVQEAFFKENYTIDPKYSASEKGAIAIRDFLEEMALDQG